MKLIKELEELIEEEIHDVKKYAKICVVGRGNPND